MADEMQKYLVQSVPLGQLVTPVVGTGMAAGAPMDRAFVTSLLGSTNTSVSGLT